MFHGREMRGIRILVISESTGFFLIESSCSEEFGLISTFLLGVFTVLNCVVLREKRVLRVGIGGEFESRGAVAHAPRPIEAGLLEKKIAKT